MNHSIKHIENSCPNYPFYSLHETILEKELSYVFSIVSAQRAKDGELFRETHTKIKAIERNKVIDEDKILYNIKSRIKNNFLTEDFRFPNQNEKFYIKGETGTGKSELTWFIKINLEEDEEFREKLKIINIPKNYSWLMIVNEILIPEIDKLIPGALKFENYTQDSYKKLKDNYNKHKSKTCFELAGSIAGELFESGLTSIGEGDEYYEKLVKPIQQALETNFKNMFIKLDDKFDEKIFQKIFNDSTCSVLSEEIPWKHAMESNTELKKQLNFALTKSLKKRYNIPSLNEVLSKIAIVYKESLQNRIKLPRLLMIFEDFGLEDEDAKNFGKFMNVDEYNYIDFLIAGTPNSFSDLYLPSSLSDRVTEYWTNEEENVYTKFLTEENITEFIGKYLKFFKKRLVKNYNLSLNIDDLLPFSGTFIKRIFICSKPIDKKPREIIKLFSEMIGGGNYGEFPFEIVSKRVLNRSEVDSKLVKRLYNNIDEKHKQFLIWYGEIDKKDSRLKHDNKIAEIYRLNFTKFQKSQIKVVISKPINKPIKKSADQIFKDLLNENLDELKDYYHIWLANFGKSEKSIRDIDFRFKTGIKQIINEITGFKLINFVYIDNDEFFKSIRLKNIENQTCQVSFEKDKPVYDELLNPLEISWFSEDSIDNILKIGIINLNPKELTLDKNILEENRKKLMNDIIELHYLLFLNWYSEFRSNCIRKMANSASYTLFAKKYANTNNAFPDFLIFCHIIQQLFHNPILKLNNNKDIYNLMISKNQEQLISIASDKDEETAKFFQRIIVPYSQIFQAEGDLILKICDYKFSYNENFLVEVIENVINNFKKSSSTDNFYKKLKYNNSSPMSNYFHKTFLSFYNINKATQDSMLPKIKKKIQLVKEFFLEIHNIDLVELENIKKENSNVNLMKPTKDKIEKFISLVKDEKKTGKYDSKTQITSLFSFFGEISSNISKIIEIILENFMQNNLYRMYQELKNIFEKDKINIDYSKYFDLKKVLS